MLKSTKNILWYSQINKKDTALVGGKNSSLGEMFSKLVPQGVNIPDGFCLTSRAYWYFLKFNKIDKELKQIFKNFKPRSIKSLEKTGAAARALIRQAEFPANLEKAIKQAYQKMSEQYGEGVTVAVRSSATAEDLKTASFAGQMETFLNVKGVDQLLEAVRECIASLFTNRSIAYREEKGFNHLKIALSVGVQKMIDSATASSGVMFTLDTETGFRNVISINSIWGVGELIVKGKITPDQFYVFKPTLPPVELKGGFQPIIVKNLGRKNKKYVLGAGGGLKEKTVAPDQQLKFSLSDKEILTLARWAVLIEKHYKHPQDIEWAKDGPNGKLFIVQSRPETVHSPADSRIHREYHLKTDEKPVLIGIAIGDKIGRGKVHKINEVAKLAEFRKGQVLVTKMTDPDWLPAMRIASAIITDEGGRTAHAAIVARELGIPAVVGTGKATRVLKNDQQITVDCSQGSEGRIFGQKLPYKMEKHDLKKIPKLKTKIMLNIGTPEIAFKSSFLPNDGVGLAREEFIIAEKIRIHPLALYHYDKLEDKTLKKRIAKMTVEHKDKKEYFINELAEGVGQIAAAFYPKPVIVRFSDFKSNEYRQLIGGSLFEPIESNPMLGWRGASRYYSLKFQPAFLMECKAVKRARDVFGLKNIKLMIPFCRTPEEAQKVLDLMEKAGLKRGDDGLEVYVMAEIPSNVALIDEFLDILDGASIGSNDLTQLAIGIDRDNADLAKIADERNKTVKKMISQVIKACKQRSKYCGICGQAPSDHQDFAQFLINQGIESISLTPDTVIKTILDLSKK